MWSTPRQLQYCLYCSHTAAYINKAYILQRDQLRSLFLLVELGAVRFAALLTTL